MAAKKSSKSQSKKKKPKKGSYAKNGERYPALNPRRQVFARREYMDGDYYHLLNEEEKKWLNSFLSETIVTNFYHGGPELYTDVEDKRQFYRDNNSRNKDALNWAKSKSMLSNVVDIYTTLDREEAKTPSEIEDSWLQAIVTKGSKAYEEELKQTLYSFNESKQAQKESNKPTKVNKKGLKKTK